MKMMAILVMLVGCLTQWGSITAQARWSQNTIEGIILPPPDPPIEVTPFPSSTSTTTDEDMKPLFKTLLQLLIRSNYPFMQGIVNYPINYAAMQATPDPLPPTLPPLTPRVPYQTTPDPLPPALPTLTQTVPYPPWLRHQTGRSKSNPGLERLFQGRHQDPDQSATYYSEINSGTPPIITFSSDNQDSDIRVSYQATPDPLPLALPSLTPSVPYPPLLRHQTGSSKSKPRLEHIFQGRQQDPDQLATDYSEINSGTPPIITFSSDNEDSDIRVSYQATPDPRIVTFSDDNKDFNFMHGGNDEDIANGLKTALQIGKTVALLLPLLGK